MEELYNEIIALLLNNYWGGKKYNNVAEIEREVNRIFKDEIGWTFDPNTMNPEKAPAHLITANISLYEKRLESFRDLLLAGKASNWEPSPETAGIPMIPAAVKTSVLGNMKSYREELLELKGKKPTEGEIYQALRNQWGMPEGTSPHVQGELMKAVKAETDLLWPQQQSQDGTNPATGLPWANLTGQNLLDMFGKDEGFINTLTEVLDDRIVTPEEKTAIKTAMMSQFGGVPPTTEDPTELEERKIRQLAPETVRIYETLKDSALLAGKTEDEKSLWVDRNADMIIGHFSDRQDSERAQGILEKDQTSLEEFVRLMEQGGYLSPEIPTEDSWEERQAKRKADDDARIWTALAGQDYWDTDVEKWQWIQDHSEQVRENVDALQNRQKAAGWSDEETTSLEVYLETQFNPSVIKQIEEQAIAAGKTVPIAVPDETSPSGFTIINVSPEEKLIREAQEEKAAEEAAEEAARRGTIAAAPVRARIEQALLQRPFFQNMDTFTRKTYLDRVERNVTEAYGKLEAQEYAQGMLDLERTTIEQFVQDGGGGFITETMPPATTINPQGIIIDTATGKRAPTLLPGQAVARDSYAGEFKRENLRRISDDIAFDDAAFRKWLAAKIASPKLQEEFRKEDREYRVAAFGPAYEKAYTAEREGEVPMGDPITIDKGRADLSPPTFPALEGVAPFRKAGETRAGLGTVITSPNYMPKTYAQWIGERQDLFEEEFYNTPEGAIFAEQNRATALRPTGEALKLGGRVSPLGRI